MRPAFILRVACAATLLFAAGCSSSNKGKIEGTKWTSLAATVKGKALPDGFSELHFGPDGHSVVYKAGSSDPYGGSYSLGMGSAVTLTLDRELEGRKIHVEKITIDGDQLTMTDSDGMQLTFQRAK
jgi:hypothetical protein